MTGKPLPRLGKLEPRYLFALNPPSAPLPGRCPICEQRMGQRKLPLFVHVDPFHPVIVGFTCRFCAVCDLLIADQERLEGLLAAMFAKHNPSVIGNDYLVLGTVERAAWREGMRTPSGVDLLLANLHDFKEVRTLEYRPAGWYPPEEAGDGPPPAQEAVHAKPAASRPRPAPGPRKAKRRGRNKRR